MENLYVFKGNVAKKLIKEFMNEGWGLNKLLKKLQETGTTARRSGSIESIQNISCFFLFCNINTQTGYYKKEISHLFENFLTCNVTNYY